MAVTRPNRERATYDCEKDDLGAHLCARWRWM